MPQSAWVVLFLMVLPSSTVLNNATSYISFPFISFLGNLGFLLFIRAWERETGREWTLFFLGLVLGLAIYSYTYTILHFTTIFVLFVLAQPNWEVWRGRISRATLKGYLAHRASRREKIAALLDLVLALFLAGILFAYVFGGFGLDIAGHTILQINKLYQPIYQMAVLLLIRVLVYNKDLVSKGRALKLAVGAIQAQTRRRFACALSGFVLGISPRIASILTGETRRGGQGMDMDLDPFRVVRHTWQLLTQSLPEVLGVRKILVESLGTVFESPETILVYTLNLVVLTLVLMSGVVFLWGSRGSFKRLITVRTLEFQPIHLFLVFPLAVFGANIITMNGPLVRYLFPVFGALMVWTALFLDQVRRKSVPLFVILLMAWAGCHLEGYARFYNEAGMMKGFDLVEIPEPLWDVIGFCRDRKIPTAYGDLALSHKATFLANGNPLVSEYTRSAKGVVQKSKSDRIPRFALITPEGEDRKVFHAFLEENGVGFRERRFGVYEVLWDFQGDRAVIEKLRSLIP
ncbi:MAG: hypothetical protein COV67_13750 [Nitrospinae bacterium CG11_big_fil_rev_8_21_14_0_20_56_8]|nr:MAG: hypothetical protein COV67_13750 [Nitrospinae bacterium CG11_big_fil_rev_8_21_14_0_20_56_8]